MANTKDTMGPQGVVDALVEDSLTSLEDSDVTKVETRCLSERKSLTSVTLHNCGTVGQYGMADNVALLTVDIMGGGRIYDYAFQRCQALTSLIMRSTTLTTGSSYAFEYTPIEAGEGAVYVPTSVLSKYRAAPLWKSVFIADIADYPATDYSTITDSWSQIIAACGDGTYSTKYEVGDTKAIEIDGSTYYMQLVAKDADVLASDGTTTVPTTWLIWKKFYTPYTMNDTGTTSGGWEASGMRSWLSGTVLPLLPAEVQAAIKEVRKYSDTYESAIVHDQQTADKLWIPSAREIFGGASYEQTGPLYTGHFLNGVIRRKYNANGSSTTWWLRSASAANTYRYVTYDGGVANSSPTASAGVALGFCI